MPTLPRLYAIVDRFTLNARGIPVSTFAQQLRDAGVRLLQYRDKHGIPQQILAAAADISAVFAGTDATLVMNDRADLAILAGWRAVHVGHTDMPPEAVRHVLCPKPSPGLLVRGGTAHAWSTQSSVNP